MYDCAKGQTRLQLHLHRVAIGPKGDCANLIFMEIRKRRIKGVERRDMQGPESYREHGSTWLTLDHPLHIVVKRLSDDVLLSNQPPYVVHCL